ncbi:TIGR02302 family protein [Bartonella sp. LJL80]
MSDENPSRFQVPKLVPARARAWCVLTFERLWPRLLPSVLALLLLAALAWFGIFNRMSYWVHLIVLWALLFAAVGSLFLLAGFRRPTNRDIDRRIEQASSLANQPLEALNDIPVNPADNAYAQALWAEHQRRMAAQLQNLQAGLPNTAIARKDPFALRSLVVLLAITGFAFSYGSNGGRLSDAFDFRAPVNLSAMRVDAWVTPPAYTGEAPIYLTQANISSVKVAEGSKVSVRVVDGGGAVLKLTDSADGKVSYPTQIADKAVKHNNAISFETVLKTSANLSLSARRYEKNWHFDVVADGPPSIRLAKEPGRILGGSLELNYALDDDYGVEKAYVEIKPTADMPEAGHPLYAAPEIKLLIPRGGKGEGRTVQDVTNHPWAGSEVTITLVAEDGAGHIAKSESRTMTLPQRIFGNPLARAVVEQRRLLALDTMARDRVLDMLSAITLRPEDTIENYTHFLTLRSAWTRLSLAPDDDALRDVADYMWQIALGIEGDAVDQAEKNLKQAQAALRDALRNGASPEEIERLSEALRQAMNDYMAALAERAQNGGLEQKPSENAQTLSPNELEEKLKQLEEMAKTGNRAAAEQLLSELENMMDNLQMQPGGQGSGQAGNKTDQMQKQMDKLGDLMRRQQEALNDTHRLEDEKQRGEKTPEQYQNELDKLREKQDGLQSELNQLQKDLSEQGLKPGEELKDAENKMAQSGEAMGQGEGQSSAQNQADALEAMRNGAQGLMKQMQEAMKKDGEGQKGEGEAAQDPLGRKLGSTGSSRQENGELPQESDMQRARRILDEIRKRLGQSFTPEMEKDYLERLLKFD